MYILKGASADGNSAPVKKSWGRVKLRAPRISAVLPKMPSRPHVSSAVAKIVNDVCYGNMSEEKMEAFLTAAYEVSNDEKKVRFCFYEFRAYPRLTLLFHRSWQIFWSKRFKPSTSSMQRRCVLYSFYTMIDLLIACVDLS